MQIGIDFGTSFSAAAVFKNNRITPIRFGKERQFRTAVFFPESLPDSNEFMLTSELEAQVENSVRSSKARQRREAERANRRRQEAAQRPASERAAALAMIINPISRSDDELRREATRTVRRQWLEESMRKARASAAQLQDALYGDEAVAAYIAEGAGHLVQSPKTMLGYRLLPHARRVILGITSRIFEYIRLTAGQQIKTTVRSALIGRPVRFRSSEGDAGSENALEIMRQAAMIAGFDKVEFIYEPSAAAMHYHLASAKRHTTLVVDVGGGTTDVAYAEVGGFKRKPSITAAWGLEYGGKDIDLNLSLHRFMPLFGKDVLNIPVHQFVDAALVHDLPRQRHFRNYDYRQFPRPYGSRLRSLQRGGNTTRLNRAVERTKILLSARDLARARLSFIERGLEARVSNANLQLAAESFLTRFDELLSQVRDEIDEQPATVFLTGGMSQAPYVRSRVVSYFPASKLIRGNPSMAVVSGLAFAAARGLF